MRVNFITSSLVGLRHSLAKIGMKKGAISNFVDEAVQLHLLDLVTVIVKNCNKQYDKDDILSIAEAVSTN